MAFLCFALFLRVELTLGNESLTELLIKTAAGTLEQDSSARNKTAEVVLLNITIINVQLGKYPHWWSD